MAKGGAPFEFGAGRSAPNLQGILPLFFYFKGVTLFKLTRSGTESGLCFFTSILERVCVCGRCEVRAHVCVVYVSVVM